MIQPRRIKRDVHGVLLLNKPKGVSSNDVLQKVKRLFNASKAGHTGALDPLATGMLPICFGEATKFAHFSLEADKRYRVNAKLGQRTTTSDSEGQIVIERNVDFCIKKLTQALESLRGEIFQVPSMYSALKYQGKPWYEYARKGIEIPRPARKITIHELNLLNYKQDELVLEIHCSKGTYIRTLVDDLGELLGCGAHVTQLHRLQVSNYPVAKMVSFEYLADLQRQLSTEQSIHYDLLDKELLSMDFTVIGLPEVNLSNELTQPFLLGQKILPTTCVATGWVRVTSGSERHFIGVGYYNNYDRKLLPKRLINGHMLPNLI